MATYEYSVTTGTHNNRDLLGADQIFVWSRKMYYLVLAVLAKVRQWKYHIFYCKGHNEKKTLLLFRQTLCKLKLCCCSSTFGHDNSTQREREPDDACSLVVTSWVSFSGLAAVILPSTLLFESLSAANRALYRF